MLIFNFFVSSWILLFVPSIFLYNVISKYFPTIYSFVLDSINLLEHDSFTSNTNSSSFPLAISLNSLAVISLFSTKVSIKSFLLISTFPVVLTVNVPSPILSESFGKIT